MSKHKESENEYLVKVNLKGRRSIWRTVLLRGDQTLDDLHEVIFVAFDRYDEHLYSSIFQRRGVVAYLPTSRQKNTDLRADLTKQRGLKSITGTTRPKRDSMISSSKSVKPLNIFSTSVMSGGTRSSCRGSDQVSLVELTRESLKNDCHLRHNILRAMSDVP
jgi:hypothetical protein